MNRPLRGLSALALLIALAVPLTAEAQRKPVFQDGIILPNHLTKQTTTGLIKDVGSPAVGDAQGKGISPIGITDSLSLLGVCSYSDDPTKSGSYLCLGHDAAGVPTISVGATAGGPAPACNFNINGAYTTPCGGGGSVVFIDQTANKFFAGPTTGTAQPAFRSLVYADLPLNVMTANAMLRGGGAGLPPEAIPTFVYANHPTQLVGVTAKIDNAFDAGVDPVTGLANNCSATQGGLNAGSTYYTRFCMSQTMSSTLGQQDTVLFLYAPTDGIGNTAGSMLKAGGGLQIYAIAAQNYDYSVGANFIVGGGGVGKTVKLNPLELDIQAVPGTILASTFGLIINVFDGQTAQAAIFANGIGSGRYANGIIIGGVATAGVAFSPLEGTNDMGSLIGTGNANYSISAISIANDNGTGNNVGSTHQSISFNGTTGGHYGLIFENASNNLIISSQSDAVVLNAPVGGVKMIGLPTLAMAGQFVCNNAGQIYVKATACQ